MKRLVHGLIAFAIQASLSVNLYASPVIPYAGGDGIKSSDIGELKTAEKKNEFLFLKWVRLHAASSEIKKLVPKKVQSPGSELDRQLKMMRLMAISA